MDGLTHFAHDGKLSAAFRGRPCASAQSQWNGPSSDSPATACPPNSLTVSSCSNGLILSPSAILFRSSASRHRLAVAEECSGGPALSSVIRLSVQSSSFLPQRPQLDISWTARLELRPRDRLGRRRSVAGNPPAGPAIVNRSTIGTRVAFTCPILTSLPVSHASGIDRSPIGRLSCVNPSGSSEPRGKIVLINSDEDRGTG